MRDRKLGRRRLIICCDGTWNRPGGAGNDTNVIRMVRAVTPTVETPEGEYIQQITYYHTGVGTGNFVDKIFGGATGIGLSENVRTAYGFIADNYSEGDEIFLFGFSRGAYTVRSVAGLIGHVGILRKEQMEYFNEVWKYYKSWNKPINPSESEFLNQTQLRHRISEEKVSIKCIGVWDTVGALGIPENNISICRDAYSFHDTDLGPGVENAFQALAIDEHRAAFQPAIWHPSQRARVRQHIKQVWFPGTHSNIGGGYDDRVLSDATFLWMVNQIKDYLDLDHDYICKQCDRRRPYAAGKLVNSRTGRWRFDGYLERPICSEDPNTEYVHESAWLRVGSKYLDSPYGTAEFKGVLAQYEHRKEKLSHYEQDMIQNTKSTNSQPSLSIVPSRSKTMCDRVVSFLGSAE